jgi:hypothetical protein
LQRLAVRLIYGDGFICRLPKDTGHPWSSKLRPDWGTTMQLAADRT